MKMFSRLTISIDLPTFTRIYGRWWRGSGGDGIGIRTIDLTTRFARRKHLNAQSAACVCNGRRIEMDGGPSRN